MSRYFVTVYARSADDLRHLQQYGLDLFPQTAKQERAEENQERAEEASHPLAIDGLLTIEEVETLVGNGYQVRLDDTVEARSNTGESLEFGDWLEGMQTTLASDKTIK